MQPSVAELSRIAEQAARAGAAAIRSAVEHGGIGVEGKSASHDLVTSADRASEHASLAVLRRHRPEDTIIAEESGVHRGATQVRWLVDPLDGTANFVHGRKDYAVSVAAERQGTVVAGAIYRPADDEWVVGGGSEVRGSDPAPSCSTSSELRHALIGVGFPYAVGRRLVALERVRSLIPEVRDFRRTGSAACDLLAITCGQLDAFLGFELAAWDVAAGHAVVPAAGGSSREFHTLDGTAVFVAGAARVVDRLEAVLRAGA